MQTHYRRIIRGLLALVAMGIFSTAALAQPLVGSYTIDSSTPTGGTNFQTFGDAASSLGLNGVAGPVVFNVLQGTYNEQVTFTAAAGASPVNSITINGNGDTISFSGSSSDRHVIRLDGAKYMTIDNLVIVATNTTYGWGVQLRNGADSNTVKNCYIDVSAVTSTSSSNSIGVVASGSNTSVTTSGDNANALTLDSNEIVTGYYGIRLNGQTGGLNASGHIITNNTVRDYRLYGIYLDDTDGTLVFGNDISRANRVSVGTFYGVFCTAGNRNVIVEKNRIHNTHDNASSLTGAAYGIYFSSCDAPAGSENIAVNNLIYNFNGNGTIYGLYNFGSDGTYFYHNTVSLDHAPATGGTTRGFYQTSTATNIQVFNNLFSITRGGSGSKHGVYLGSTTSTVLSDNNAIHVGGNGSGGLHVGYYSGNQTTLADWQAANSSAYGQNSVAADPLFVDITNNNYVPAASLIDNIGANLGVGDDLAGVARTTTPDPGAFEFTPPADDAGISALISPVPACAGANNLVVELSNFGADTLDSVTINWTMNGGSVMSQSFTGTIFPGNNQQISLGSVSITGATDFVIWTVNPNGQTDANNNNDTLTITGLQPGFASGTYTIDAAVVTGGTNFQSFGDAVSAMALAGICGPVVFDVVPGSGTYNEQVDIPQILGTSSVNTITINGNGDTLAFAPTSSDRYVLRLSGVDHLTVDSLVIVSTSTTYGYGIALTNASDSNTIQNCVIDLSGVTSTSSTNTTGILASGSPTSTSTAGNNANSLLVMNNEVIGGYYGIRLNGNTGGSDAVNNTVENNIVRDFYAYGIYMDDNTSPVIRLNDISRANRTSVTTFYGVFFTSGNTDGLIERNRVHNSHDNASSQSGSAYGIYLSGSDAPIGSENIIVNNLVYNMNSTTGLIYGLYNSSSDGSHWYHNTVSLDHQGATAGTTRGFYQTATATNVEIVNNIFSITRGGSGTHHGLYFNTTSSTILSDNNGVHMGGTGGSTQHFGRYGTSDFTTLLDWQTANSGAYGQNSAAADPQFIDLANDDYTPNASAFNNVAALVGVTEDFFGIARGVAPDFGAIEFSPPADDAGISQLLQPIPACPGLNTLEVELTNFGADTLDSVQVFWSVNGGAIDSLTYMGPLAPGNTDGVVLGTINVTGSIDILAWNEGPNNQTDADASNDTLNIVGLLPSLAAGTYSINSAVATGGTNYQSYTDAVNALNNLGICGPVVFEVVPGSGPYNEQIVLGDVVGSSATNTITFNGKLDTLQFNATSTDRYLVRLNGARHVTLDSMVIKSTSTTYGYGVHLTNGADSNTITNSVIDLGDVTSTSSSNSTGILASGSNISTSTSGNNASYLVIENNEVIGGYYGIRLNGNSGGLDALDNEIVENEVRDFYAYGVYLDDNDGAWVQGNDISRANRTSVTTFYGVFMTAGNRNVLVEQNEIHNTHDNATSQTGSAYAIYSSSCDAPVGEENLVVNNLAYNFNSNGTVYALYNFSSNGVYYYHNTISLDHTSATGGTTRGVYQTTTASNIEIKNNIISITRGGSGTKHGLYFNATGSTIESDNNVLYVNSAGSGAQHYGRYSTDFTSFADWQTANSGAYDQNSWSVDPLFADIANADFTPGDTTFNNQGDSLGVMEDFFGDARPATTPDPGAIEFDVLLNDIEFVAYLEPDTAVCASDSQAVFVVLTNNGLLSQTGVNITVNVTGDLTTSLTGTSGSIAFQDNDTVLLGFLNTSTATNINLSGFTGLTGDQVVDNDSLSLAISILANPTVALGNDTSICTGETVVLDAGAGFASYDWNGGLATTQTLSVTMAGTYTIEVTNADGCAATDDLVVTTFTSPVVNLGADTAFCAGNSITLDAGAGFTYSWNGGVVTTQTLNADTTGSYTVEITDGNNCVAMDTLNLVVNANPTVNLGNDTSYCANEPFSLTLDAGAGFSYDWNNGAATTQTFTVISSGTYDVVITDGNNCSATDSIEVVENAVPALNLGNDTSYCAGGTINLTLDAGSGFTYSWNGGTSTAQTLNVSTDGNYFVVITDGNGCTNTDSLEVIENALPVVDLGPDTNLCGGDVLLDAGAGFTYLWNDGTTGQTLVADTLGTYSVEITDANGCTNTDTIFVDDCVSVTEVALNNRFRLFPNPAVDQLWIAGADQNEVVEVIITDLTGKTAQRNQVRLAPGTQEAISLDGLSSGIYLVRLTVNEQLEVHRIIVR